MSNQTLSRREFLQVAVMGAAGVAVAACQPKTIVVKETVEVEKVVKETVEVEKEVTKVVEKEKEVTKIVEQEKVVTATPAPIREAPELYGLVETGALSPVEERLPAEPMLIEPFEEIGQYGGTLRRLHTTTDGTKQHTISCYENSLRWDLEVRNIIPNVIAAWEISEDGKEFTLFFRKGVKWSDGQPFSVDDVMFYLEDILGNEELPRYPAWLAVGGEPVKPEKVDDFALKLRFAAPNGFLLYRLTSSSSGVRRPKHYLQQFHPTYASKAELDKKVEESGLEDWADLFLNRADNYVKQNPDYPVIEAWHPTTEPPSTRYTFKRNPYYWKVDSDGNQLPYINEEIMTIVTNAEVLKLDVLMGKTDMQQRGLSFDYYPLLKENEEKGNYRVLLWDNDNAASPAIQPNQNAMDEVLRALIQDDRFRIALSHAINREQVNEMVFHGGGVPRQATVVSTSPSYKEEYGRAHADYDPDKANALLDEIGLTERDADGFRLRPDGETLFLLLETAGEDPAAMSQMELVKTYWEEAGIKTDIEASERGIFRSRVHAGENIMPTWNLGVYNRYSASGLVPVSPNTYWATSYGRWYQSGGEAGEEPPGDIRKLQIILDELTETVDLDKQEELFGEILDLHAEHCWMIGIVGEVPRPVAVNKDIRNFPERALASWSLTRYIGVARIEQIFFKR